MNQYQSVNNDSVSIISIKAVENKQKNVLQNLNRNRSKPNSQKENDVNLNSKQQKVESLKIRRRSALL